MQQMELETALATLKSSRASGASDEALTAAACELVANRGSGLVRRGTPGAVIPALAFFASPAACARARVAWRMRRESGDVGAADSARYDAQLIAASEGVASVVLEDSATNEIIWFEPFLDGWAEPDPAAAVAAEEVLVDEPGREVRIVRTAIVWPVPRFHCKGPGEGPPLRGRWMRAARSRTRPLRMLDEPACRPRAQSDRASV